MLGIPLEMGNSWPDSGHCRQPSITSTCGTRRRAGSRASAQPLDGTVKTTWPKAILLVLGCVSWITLNQWGKSLMQQRRLETRGFQSLVRFPTHGQGRFTTGWLACTFSILIDGNINGTKHAAAKFIIQLRSRDDQIYQMTQVLLLSALLLWFIFHK